MGTARRVRLRNLLLERLHTELRSLGDMGKGFAGATVGWMGDLRNAAGDYSKAYVRAEHEIAAAIKSHIDLLKDLNTSFNPKLGTEPKGSSSAGFTPPVINDAIDQNRLLAQAESENAATSDRLADAKEKATVAESKLATAIKMTTSVAADQSAQQALDKQKLADISEQYGILNNAIYTETRMQTADVAAHKASIPAYEGAKDALLSFTHAHAGAKDMSEADKETMTALKAIYDAAKTTFDSTASVVRTVTDTLRSHREEAARDAAQQYELAHATEIAAAAAQKAWDTFTTDEQNKMGDDLQTFQMTNSQKVAFCANAIAQMGAVSAANLEQMKSDYQAEESAFKSMISEEVAARKAALEKEEAITQTFLSDMLTEHKTFGEEVKAILASMVKDYVDAMSKMLFSNAQPNSGSFFQQLFGAISPQNSSATGTFSTSVSKFQQAVDAFSRLGETGRTGGGGILPLTGGQALATQQTPSGTALVTLTGGVDAEEIASDVNKAGGTTTPVAGDTMTSYANPGAPGSPINMGWTPQAAMALSQSMNQANTAGWGVGEGQGAFTPAWGVGVAPGAPSSSGMTAGQGVGAALMGYGIGENVNSLMYPNELRRQGFTAGLGGALGDVGGTMVAGPVGGFIGAILGSLIGGLFGPHETAAQEPDVSEPNYGTQWTYGQFVSNMLGTYGTYNGQYVAAQQGYSQYYGNKSMESDLVQTLQTLPKDLSPAIEGVSATSS